MLNELLIEREGKRYLGQVAFLPGSEQARHAPQHWRFLHRGRIVAEFPSTERDTPVSVREHFLTVLAPGEPIESPRDH